MAETMIDPVLGELVPIKLVKRTHATWMYIRAADVEKFVTAELVTLRHQAESLKGATQRATKQRDSLLSALGLLLDEIDNPGRREPNGALVLSDKAYDEAQSAFEKVNGAVKAYRKKPVVVEAVQFVKDSAWEVGTNIFKIDNWIHDNGGDTAPRPPDALGIVTLEGTMWAGLGDWIIRGVQGEFYPCKPDIFDATYEAVE